MTFLSSSFNCIFLLPRINNDIIIIIIIQKYLAESAFCFKFSFRKYRGSKSAKISVNFELNICINGFVV